MIGRPLHKSAGLILLEAEPRKILEDAKERLARAGGDIKIKEAIDKCLENLEMAISVGDCSLEDARTVKRELEREARDRRFELNTFD
ncbi:hypothetical protein [Pseudomonas alabamensis]|uniref:hypothetical protein n=1 Tax=Pseudomonas alabamensis TaxID=3064349 RepID=UPI0011A31068